jgi:hypothetical protein
VARLHNASVVTSVTFLEFSHSESAVQWLCREPPEEGEFVRTGARNDVFVMRIPAVVLVGISHVGTERSTTVLQPCDLNVSLRH